MGRKTLSNRANPCPDITFLRHATPSSITANPTQLDCLRSCTAWFTATARHLKERQELAQDMAEALEELGRLVGLTKWRREERHVAGRGGHGAQEGKMLVVEEGNGDGERVGSGDESGKSGGGGQSDGSDGRCAGEGEMGLEERVEASLAMIDGETIGSGEACVGEEGIKLEECIEAVLTDTNGKTNGEDKGDDGGPSGAPKEVARTEKAGLEQDDPLEQLAEQWIARLRVLRARWNATWNGKGEAFFIG